MTVSREAPPVTLAPAGRLYGSRSWLVVAERARARDLALVTGALVAVAAAVFGSHVVDGSFYYDDWANSARTQLAGGYGNALQSFWDLTGYRPVLAFYVPTLHEVLGEHAPLHLAWAVFLAVLMSTALYAVLVEVGIARLHAFAVGALVLVFPFSDATRFWAQASSCHLTAALWLTGLCVAMRALIPGRSRRSALVFHGVSLALYLTSLLFYELPATLMLAGGLLYVLRAGWSRGLKRWAADLGIVVPAVTYVVATTKIPTTSDRGGSFEHAKMIVDQGWSVMASAAWPFGAPQRSAVTAIVAIVVGAAGVTALRSLPADPDRETLRRWLVVAGGGFAAAWTAWAIFVPSDPYYSPGSAGVGNRVNSLAAMGIVILLYAVALLGWTLVLRPFRLPQPTAPVVAFVVTLLVLGAGYVERVGDDQAAWATAAGSARRTLTVLRTELPDPEPNSVIWTFGQVAWQAPGVPVFASHWDLNGAVQLLYDDPTLRGYPAVPSTTFGCGADGVIGHAGHGAPEFAYGSLYFVDISSRNVGRITDANDCRTATARFRPGPT